MQSSDDLSLLAIWTHVRRRWRILVSVTVLSILAAILLALWITPVFRAEVVFVEVTEGARSGRSGALLGQFAGLASMAGADLSGLGGASRQPKAILRSRVLAEEFIRSNDLMKTLLSDQWDEETEKWRTDSGNAPSIWWAVKAFTENVRRIEDDPVNGTTRLSIEWTNPKVAAEWANLYVALANELIRARDLAQARDNIEYLRKQIELTAVVQHQQALFNILERELQTEMLANARAQYAFAVVDPAVPPELRVRPHRTFIVIIGAMLGLLFGLMVIALLTAIERPNSVPGGR